MNLKYGRSSVEKHFKDFDLLKRKIGNDLTKNIKKRLDQLRASANFSIFLSTGLGKPHPLYENLKGCYGISISGSIRLLVRPDVKNLDPDSLKNCNLVIIEGVIDYHDQKYKWLIP